MPERLSRGRGPRMVLALAIAAAVSLSAAALARHTVPPLAAAIEQVEPVVVPQGNGAPVITDGVFSAGEWDDALRVALSDAVDLYVKEYGGVVFLGVRNAMVGPSDLFLAVPGGPIHQLHVSAQLGEAVLPPTGEAPPMRFGLTRDWYANEQRRDVEEAERMQKAGKPFFEIVRATSYPSDGIEFAIRRSKFPGQRWLMRLEASVLLAADKPGMLIYPPGGERQKTDGWLELQFK